MFNCPRCNEGFERGTRFCPKCGLNLAKEFIYNPVCPTCKKSFPAGTKFCDVDGSKLIDSSKLVPKCTVCGKEYDESTKVCPDDGGKVATEAELELEKAVKERYEAPAQQYHVETDFNSLAKDGYETDIFGWIGKGWELVKADFWLYILIQLAYIAAFFVISLIPVLKFIVLPVIALFCAMALTAGLYYVPMKRIRGEVPQFADFFAGFVNFVPLLALQWVAALLVLLGFIVFVIPSIYLAVSYVFAPLLIIDRDMDFWPAMEASRRVVTKRWFSIFFFLVLAELASAIGIIGLGIGLFVTMPILYCSTAAAYDDIFGISRGPAAITVEQQTNTKSF